MGHRPDVSKWRCVGGGGTTGDIFHRSTAWGVDGHTFHCRVLETAFQLSQVESQCATIYINIIYLYEVFCGNMRFATAVV